jgi:hypothetical protein
MSLRTRGAVRSNEACLAIFEPFVVLQLGRKSVTVAAILLVPIGVKFRTTGLLKVRLMTAASYPPRYSLGIDSDEPSFLESAIQLGSLHQIRWTFHVLFCHYNTSN